MPRLLLALVGMILEGPSMKDKMADTNPAEINEAQILNFNSVEHKQTRGTTSSTQEGIVDSNSHLGLSISYDRMLQLSAQMGNNVCRQFHRELVVCPPKMRGEAFTTVAVDKICHNPSATASKDSFHVPLSPSCNILLTLVKE